MEKQTDAIRSSELPVTLAIGMSSYIPLYRTITVIR